MQLSMTIWDFFSVLSCIHHDTSWDTLTVTHQQSIQWYFVGLQSVEEHFLCKHENPDMDISIYVKSEYDCFVPVISVTLPASLASLIGELVREPSLHLPSLPPLSLHTHMHTHTLMCIKVEKEKDAQCHPQISLRAHTCSHVYVKYIHMNIYIYTYTNTHTYT